MSRPRFELSPTTRFADRAADYALFRPSYPPEAIDFALDGLPVSRPLVAADIGAGTGISSRLLADRGLRVIAIEPSDAMRESAETHRGVTFKDGTAEATGLEEASVDLVLCAQAFHWFSPAEAISEFWRILKPEARLVLMINERDATAAPTRAYNAAMRAATERELSEGMRETIEEALRAASQTVTPRSFPCSQSLTREGLVGRARSASYAPREGPRHERLLRDLDDLWTAHHDAEGLVALRYRTLVYRVERK